MTIQHGAEMVAIPGGRPGSLKSQGKSRFAGKHLPVVNQWVNRAVGKHPTASLVQP